MINNFNILQKALFAFVLLFSGLEAKVNLAYTFNGPSEANDYSGDLPAVFEEFCDGACVPTVKLPLLDSKTGNIKGTLYAWGKNFKNDGNIPPQTICFDEFLLFELNQGQVYALSGGSGACGAFMNPSLVPPLSSPDATVLAGGGDGEILGGSGGFKNIAGSYTSRVFVEAIDGVFVFYNGGYISLKKE